MFRYGKSADAKCPLCGQPDGGHHAVSGCKEVSRPVTNRHNKAARMILQAILKGRHGANLAAADVGSRKRRREDQLPLDLPNRIPDAAFPPDMPLADRRALQQQHRPDGVLYTPQDPAGYAMKFIEVKYCRDTDPEAQMLRAETQHGPTIREINQYYERARI